MDGFALTFVLETRCGLRWMIAQMESQLFPYRWSLTIFVLMESVICWGELPSRESSIPIKNGRSGDWILGSWNRSVWAVGIQKPRGWFLELESSVRNRYPSSTHQIVTCLSLSLLERSLQFSVQAYWLFGSHSILFTISTENRGVIVKPRKIGILHQLLSWFHYDGTSTLTMRHSVPSVSLIRCDEMWWDEMRSLFSIV
jgi:hypothetical protein